MSKTACTTHFPSFPSQIELDQANSELYAMIFPKHDQLCTRPEAYGTSMLLMLEAVGVADTLSNTMHLRPSSNVSAITSLLYILSTNSYQVHLGQKDLVVLKDGKMQS